MSFLPTFEAHLTPLQLSVYTITGLIFCLMTWFDIFERADTIRAGNRTELVFSGGGSSSSSHIRLWLGWHPP